jgi:hypothetical protein
VSCTLFLVNARARMNTFSSSHVVDDGVARGTDALTILENRATYSLFVHELHRVRSGRVSSDDGRRASSSFSCTRFFSNVSTSIA